VTSRPGDAGIDVTIHDAIRLHDGPAPGSEDWTHAWLPTSALLGDAAGHPTTATSRGP
jgi:hypothetical protein